MERKRDTLYKEIFLQKGVIVKEASRLVDSGGLC